jgi:ADP-ribose pyrophosphatase
MPLPRWKTLSTSLLFENRWWRYRKDLFELPSGRTGEYHFVETRGSAMLLPLRPDGRIVLVNQYRYLHDRESLEFPCGSVGVGDDHLSTARKELAEEAGLAASGLVPIGEFNPYNGVAREICRVFLATGLSATAAHPDETEEFEIVPLLPREIDDRIADGTIWDGMTMAAWAIGRGRVAALPR